MIDIFRLLHTLLSIETYEDLFSTPYYSASFEGYVIENILSNSPRFKASFYRTLHGSEIDLILEKGTKKIAIGIKSSSSPKVTSGFYRTIEELQIDAAMVVANIDRDYPLKNGVMAVSLLSCLDRLPAVI